MNRLAAGALSALVCAAGGEGASAQDRNVVVILMDDVGTDFLSMFDARNPYGATPPSDGEQPLYAQTPRLEQLAADGVTFLDAYAMPRCSPTRACLYTGNYPVRHGVGNLVIADYQGDLHEFGDPGYESTTLAQLATSVGYADTLIGKWHLGMPDPLMDPWNGADCYLGWSSIPERGHWSEWSCAFRGISSYPRPAPGPGGMPPGYFNYYFSRGWTDHAMVEQLGHETTYATEVQFEAALEFCNAQQGRFVCVVAPNAAHSPWAPPPPPELVNTDGYVQGPANAFALHAAMLEALDTKIGQFHDGMLEPIRDQTLFIVMGDNGSEGVCLRQARLSGAQGEAVGSGIDVGEVYDQLLDAPEERFKSSVYEKGTRVPMIVSGAGVASPGRTSTALVDVTDVYPTVAEVIGADPGDVHGISFLPVLEGSSEGERDFTYAELFRPLGSTAPEAVHDERKIGCSLRIDGQGRFKVVRDSDLADDRLFRLEDENGELDDPWELTPLPHEEGDPHRAAYLAVLERMDEIAASGAATGGTPCGSTVDFCPAQPNSTGQVATLSTTGSHNLCAGDLVLKAEDLPAGQFGVFFTSRTATELPFGDGVLCLGGTVFRLGYVASSGAGTVLMPWDASTPPTPDEQILPGEEWNLQFWYRDPFVPGGSGFNFSDALGIRFCP